ncbi:hypothetical protein Tdes44962_MAKER06316 [Teratosphaeria destructans]|uniref:Uncharacterized protein n=1 Tax=Teratosphaeria destructans TaxID=418781 RepID=A0A9W7VXZ0_9PEZI|nr:hypothetical protein Tdes44962_MAKER06316 [Teratosphaeria destructans]
MAVPTRYYAQAGDVPIMLTFLEGRSYKAIKDLTPDSVNILYEALHAHDPSYYVWDVTQTHIKSKLLNKLAKYLENDSAAGIGPLVRQSFRRSSESGFADRRKSSTDHTAASLARAKENKKKARKGKQQHVAAAPESDHESDHAADEESDATDESASPVSPRMTPGVKPEVSSPSKKNAKAKDKSKGNKAKKPTPTPTVEFRIMARMVVEVLSDGSVITKLEDAKIE